jgi:F-type H+-transporting ATPase subunit b
MLEPNATFIGQIVVFLILLWFLAKFVVPPLTRMNAERQRKIAEGLAAAERGQKELQEASARANDVLREARERARQVEEQAARRSSETVEAAKQIAHGEGARIVEAARAEAGNETLRVREQLRRDFGALVVQGAARLLEREVDPKTHAQLLEQLANDIARS